MFKSQQTYAKWYWNSVEIGLLSRKSRLEIASESFLCYYRACDYQQVFTFQEMESTTFDIDAIIFIRGS